MSCLDSSRLPTKLRSSIYVGTGVVILICAIIFQSMIDEDLGDKVYAYFLAFVASAISGFFYAPVSWALMWFAGAALYVISPPTLPADMATKASAKGVGHDLKLTTQRKQPEARVVAAYPGMTVPSPKTTFVF